MPERTARRLVSEQQGLTTLEYVLLLCLLAAGLAGSWHAFGDQVMGWLGRAEVRVGDRVRSYDKDP